MAEKFSFESELWAQDDERVAEMGAWAREQKEHGLEELWFAIIFEKAEGGGECEGGNGSFRNAPDTYRLN